MDIVPVNEFERTFTVLVILFALITFSSLLGSITTAMTSLRNITQDTSRQNWLLRRYMKDHKIDPHLQLRVKSFLAHVIRLQRTVVQEKEVKLLSLLSEPLLLELRLEINRHALALHPLLDCLYNLFPPMAQKLCNEGLRTMFLASGDVLFSRGNKAVKMYIIHRGSLRYKIYRRSYMRSRAKSSRAISSRAISKRALSTVSLNEGDTDVHERDRVCEAVLWTPWWHRGHLTSLNDSEVVGIEASKFHALLEHHPECLPTVCSYAVRFVAALNSADQPTDVTKFSLRVVRQSTESRSPTPWRERSQ